MANPYHDARGRFTSKGGAGRGGSGAARRLHGKNVRSAASSNDQVGTRREAGFGRIKKDGTKTVTPPPRNRVSRVTGAESAADSGMLGGKMGINAARQVTSTSRSGSKVSRVRGGKPTPARDKPKKALTGDSVYAASTYASTRRTFARPSDSRMGRDNARRESKKRNETVGTSARSIPNNMNKLSTKNYKGAEARAVNRGSQIVEARSSLINKSKPARAKQALAQIGPDATKGYMKAGRAEARQRATENKIHNRALASRSSGRKLNRTPLSAGVGKTREQRSIDRMKKAMASNKSDPAADARVRSQSKARKAREAARTAAAGEGLKAAAEIRNRGRRNQAIITRGINTRGTKT